MANEYTVNQPDLLAQYRFAQLPSEQQLEKTQQARQEGMIAQARQKRLQDQQMQAEALKANAGGFGNTDEFAHWGSALAGLGNVVAGHRKAQQNKLARQGNEQMLAQSQAAMQQAEQARGLRAEQNQLAKARQAEQARLDQAAAAQGRHEDNLRLKRAALAQKRAKEAAEGEYGETPMVMSERKKLNALSGEVALAQKYQKMTDEDFERLAQPNGIPTEILNRAMMGAKNQGVSKFFEDKQGKTKFMGVEVDWNAVRDQVEFFNEIEAAFVIPYHSDSMAGTLSDQDLRRLTAATNIKPGQDPAILKESVQRLAGLTDSKARNSYDSWIKTGDKDAHDRAQIVLGKYYGNQEAAPEQQEAAPEQLPQATSEQRQVDHASKEQQAAMAALLNDPTTPPELRAQIEKDLAKVKGGF